MFQDVTYWSTCGLAFVVFWMLPTRLRLGLLSAASVCYLWLQQPAHVSIFLGWSLVVYFFTPLALSQKRLSGCVVPILITGTLGLLGYHKYLPTLLDAESVAETVVPLGISYLSFKLVHYVVERSRENPPPHSASEFLCYVFLLPTFSAGPIERIEHFLSSRSAAFEMSCVVEGLTRIAYGLIKRFVFCELLLAPSNFGSLTSVEVLLMRLPEVSVIKAWGFMGLLYLNAYLNFSAYSDIAIGTSRLFGLRIMENFNFPIVAVNISEFWKRWHMTLAGWCQAYIFMPMLGLTRNPYLAVFATFTVMGLWHAGSWNWLAWGLYHALGVSVHLTFQRIRRQRKWTSLDNSFFRYGATLMTILFVTAGFAFIETDGQGGIQAATTILMKLILLH